MVLGSTAVRHVGVNQQRNRFQQQLREQHDAIYLRGRHLQRYFHTMATTTAEDGTTPELTLDTIMGAVGPPNSVTPISGTVLAQWIAAGFHIAIVFNADGTFNSISHVSLARRVTTVDKAAVPIDSRGESDSKGKMEAHRIGNWS